MAKKKLSKAAVGAQKSKTQTKLSSLSLKDRKFEASVVAEEITQEIPKLLKKGTPSTSTKTVGKGKALSITEAHKKEAMSLTMMSRYMSNIGLDSDHDDFDLLDLFAQQIIDLLINQVYVFANLTKHEKMILFRYFYKSNPILGRIIDLHTELPISKIRLQAPKNVPEIVKDFVMQFYEKIFDRLNINEKIRELVLQYWIYGEAYCIVEDLFEGDRKLQELKTVEESLWSYEEEDQKFIEEIEEKYSEDPDLVGISERIKYLNTKFKNFFTVNYTGPEKLKTVKFYDINEYFTNEDIDFEAIDIELSEGLKTLLQGEGLTEEDLIELGYSEGMMKLVNESEDQKHVTIDNDIYSGLPFVLAFKRFESVSILHRVVDACLEWHTAKKAMKAKIQTLGKVGRIVTSEDLAEDQVNALRAEVELMMSDPNHAIVANFPIDWEEINAWIKDELDNLIDATDKITEELSMGLGMPDSLLSGDSQYSGDNIKVEMLNTQYFAFKVKIQNLIEDKFLKPIAHRKGLVSIDAWGAPTLIFPKLTFGLINLRADEYFDILFSLYQKGSMPVSVIYDLLNLDTHDIEHALLEDMFTIRNDQMNEIISDLFSNAADEIFEETDVVDRIIEGLNLKRKSEMEPEAESTEKPESGQNWEPK